MKNVLNWIVKILLCWGLGYLAFRYLNLFSHWLDEKVGFPFLSFLVTLAYVGFACFVAWIDRKISFSTPKSRRIQKVRRLYQTRRTQRKMTNRFRAGSLSKCLCQIRQYSQTIKRICK